MLKTFPQIKKKNSNKILNLNLRIKKEWAILFTKWVNLFNEKQPLKSPMTCWSYFLSSHNVGLHFVKTSIAILTHYGNVETNFKHTKWQTNDIRCLLLRIMIKWKLVFLKDSLLFCAHKQDMYSLLFQGLFFHLENTAEFSFICFNLYKDT